MEETSKRDGSKRRPWLTHYAGVIEPTCEYPAGNAAEQMAVLAAKAPDEAAVRGAGAAGSWGRLLRDSRRFAAALRAHGIAKGERVALLLRGDGDPQALAAFYGSLLAEAVAVPLAADLPEAELRRRLAETGAAALVLRDPQARALPAWRDGTALRVVVAIAAGGFGARLRQARPAGAGSGCLRWSRFLRDGAPSRPLLGGFFSRFALQRRRRRELPFAPASAMPPSATAAVASPVPAISPLLPVAAPSESAPAASALTSAVAPSESAPAASALTSAVAPSESAPAASALTSAVAPSESAPAASALSSAVAPSESAPAASALSSAVAPVEPALTAPAPSFAEAPSEPALAASPQSPAASASFSSSASATAALPLPAATSPLAAAPDDLAVIRYTAGTTGAARGVMLTHANLIASAEQRAAWRKLDEAQRRRYWAELPAALARGLGSAELRQGYGLAEATSLALAQPVFGKRRRGALGIPLPDTDARVVGDDDLEPLAPGEIGELALKGPQIAAGYWGRPAETAAAMQDGWLRTGDLVRMEEDGFFVWISRTLDRVRVAGQTLYPREIELVLLAHPAVEGASVAGESGRALTASVRLKPGRLISMQQLERWCRERLQPHQVPAAFERADGLPFSRPLQQQGSLLGDNS